MNLPTVLLHRIILLDALGWSNGILAIKKITQNG
jgi:hypothetical protein